MALAGERACPEIDARCQRWRVEESLGDRAAIDMHFLIRLAIDGDIDEYRREGGGNRRRGEEDLAKELERARPAARRNRANVPDDRTLRIEVGRADEQEPAF